MYDDLDEEMRQHIEERAAELVREGMSAGEARDRARREFGNVARLAERSRDVWRRPSIDETWRATAHAARALRRGGAYTLVSLITLALGIGVNTAIFSILDAALFHALPYRDPARLVRAGFPILGSPAVAVDPEFISWRNENHSFTGLVAFNGTEYTLIGSGEPERITARTVSSDFLAVLGVAPSLGRDLLPGDDHAGAAPVALISDALWHRRWNADPSVVGRPILLDKDSVTIVGVLPANFLLPGDADILVPAKFGDRPDWAAKGFGILTVIGRLKPGVTAEAAATDLERVSEAHQHDRPVFLANAEKDKRVTTFSLEQSLMSDVRPALLVLIAAVGVVLLIACANCRGFAAIALQRPDSRTRHSRSPGCQPRAARAAGVCRIAAAFGNRCCRGMRGRVFSDPDRAAVL